MQHKYNLKSQSSECWALIEKNGQIQSIRIYSDSLQDLELIIIKVPYLPLQTRLLLYKHRTTLVNVFQVKCCTVSLETLCTLNMLYWIHSVHTNPVHSRAPQQRAGPPSPQSNPSVSSRCASLQGCSSWTLQNRRSRRHNSGRKLHILGPCH